MKHAIVGNIVGFHVGRRGVLDTDQPGGINRLDQACRECRVSVGEGEPGDLKASGLDRVQTVGGGTQIPQPVHSFGLE